MQPPCAPVFKRDLKQFFALLKIFVLENGPVKTLSPLFVMVLK
jgi:hypothetical protein